jgi:hypothetical protein
MLAMTRWLSRQVSGSYAREEGLRTLTSPRREASLFKLGRNLVPAIFFFACPLFVCDIFVMFSKFKLVFTAVMRPGEAFSREQWTTDTRGIRRCRPLASR